MSDLSPDVLRQLVRLAGLECSEAELEALRGPAGRAQTALERLERLPLRDVEPATQYRVL
jgi:Asp-tRNA(Asn)/Glu-tRNA(Gln) amidotransferase C subunit